MKSIDIGDVFSPNLLNRDHRQIDGKFSAVEFREKYLDFLDNKDVWESDEVTIEIDFRNVRRLGPSWANEAFAYFTQYAKPTRILKKIRLVHITEVKLDIVKQELETGYYKLT